MFETGKDFFLLVYRAKAIKHLKMSFGIDAEHETGISC